MAQPTSCLPVCRALCFHRMLIPAGVNSSRVTGTATLALPWELRSWEGRSDQGSQVVLSALGVQASS